MWEEIKKIILSFSEEIKKKNLIISLKRLENKNLEEKNLKLKESSEIRVRSRVSRPVSEDLEEKEIKKETKKDIKVNLNKQHFYILVSNLIENSIEPVCTFKKRIKIGGY